MKKRVFHITGCLIGGGAETQMRTLCQKQLSRGYKISILYLYKHPFTEEIRNELSALGATIINFDLFSAKNLKTFFTSIRRSEIIHAHLVHTEFWALLLSIIFQKKLILTRYLPYVSRQRRKILSYFSFKKADAVICISETVKEHLKASFPKEQDKYHRIYLGLDREDLYQKLSDVNIRKHHGIDNKLIAVIPARLVPQKGIKYLLQAIMQKQCELKKWIFLFIGDGPQRRSFESFINTHNLADQIKILGFKENVYDYISQSDVVILPSSFEGFGLALLEAMCFKKPIITTAYPAILEVVDDAALMFIPNNPDTLRRSLHQLEPPTGRLNFGEKSFYRARFFTADKMFHETEQLYAKILRRPYD